MCRLCVRFLFVFCHVLNYFCCKNNSITKNKKERGGKYPLGDLGAYSHSDNCRVNPRICSGNNPFFFTLTVSFYEEKQSFPKPIK
jgi:hypothetical protein